MKVFSIFLNGKFRYYSDLVSMEKDLSRDELLSLRDSEIGILHRCTIIGYIRFEQFYNEVI